MPAPEMLGSCLKRWAQSLIGVSDTPRLDAEVLFKHVSRYSDMQLILRADESLSSELKARVEALTQARQSGTPVAYLTGEREFYSLRLKVDSRVLIPRPDTECLVDAALQCVESESINTVLDLGTGSGAIALALAHYAPELEVTATDLKRDALQLAIANAAALHLKRVHFIESDWYQSLGTERFDLIVSNPPYIDPLDPHLQQGDVRFEPVTALTAGEHGLADLRAIVAGAKAHLYPGGWIMLEHGYDQAAPVRKLLSEAGYSAIASLRDIGGNERVTMGCIQTRQSG